jgi:type IV secretory pathway TraG/TraD family ATPase VirD4
MQSVLKKVGLGDDVRALVYDAKQDFTSIVSGIAPESEIVILNPFDERGVAWNMARDITSPIHAQQVASILIPENPNASQPFFTDASRHLLIGVFISLMKNAGQAWTFRDVLMSMKKRSRLIAVLKSCTYTSDLVGEYLEEATTANNIMSTIASKLHRYEFIGAVWERAENSISLSDWLKSESILILGNDESARSALDAVNQVIFKRLTELVLAQEESVSRQTWFFLDELRQAGKLEGLSALLTKGRSKGASVVIGFQDIEGLRDVYGTQVANEIAGQCANKAILRSDSSETSNWASELFGKKEILEERLTRGSSAGLTANDIFRHVRSSSESNSTSEHVAERKVVMGSEIMNISPTSFISGLTGFFITPEFGSYWVHAKGDWLKQSLVEANDQVPNLIRRNSVQQYLNPWTEFDSMRLGLSFDVSKLPVRRPLKQRRGSGIILKSQSKFNDLKYY